MKPRPAQPVTPFRPDGIRPRRGGAINNEAGAGTPARTEEDTVNTAILHRVDDEPKPVIDAAILNHPAIGVFALTLGATCVGHVLGGSKLANDLALLVPGAALLIAGAKRLAGGRS